MSTRNSIIENTIALWSEPHTSGPSMRAILKKSAITAPALYHHFDSLQHLYAEAHEHAFASASTWFGARLDELLVGPELGPHALPALMAELIDRWCNECRHLAFVRLECLLDAARQGQPTDLATRWEYLWRDAWQTIAARCGMGAAGQGTGAVAAGLSLSHLIRVRPTIDRCCVEETSRGWVNWVLGKQAGDEQWHCFALHATERESTPIERPDGKALPLAEAAAQLLIEKGGGEVTHRSVAQKAGVSTGAVAHYFRTANDLMQGAFAVIYWQSLTRARNAVGASPSDKKTLSLMTVFNPPGPDWWSAIGWLEFHLAVARDSAFKAIDPQLRYRGGHMSKRFLECLLPSGATPTQTDKALFSNWVFGTRTQIAAKTASPDFYRENTQWLIKLLSGMARPGE